jgi:hypothetical protein
LKVQFVGCVSIFEPIKMILAKIGLRRFARQVVLSVVQAIYIVGILRRKDNFYYGAIMGLPGVFLITMWGIWVRRD